jgi:hypothetical protein
MEADMIVSGSQLVLKSRPSRYKASGAPYAVGGNRGFVLAMPPAPYPLTPQQRKVQRVAEECGIKSGMSKGDLMIKMKDCVGPKMRKGG